MMRMKTRFGGNAPDLPGLPPRAPLPGLVGAFSRRRAIFGAAAVAAAPVAILEEPEAAEARALHARRALEQALDHGTALLAALGLPPLPSMTRAIAILDAIDAPEEDLEPGLGAPERHPSGYCIWGGTDMSDRQSQAFWSDGGDPDGDREEDDPAENGGDDEQTLGWAANVSQLGLGPNTPDGDATALETYGKGFRRSGHDDAEDGHDAEGLNDEGGDEAEEIGIQPGLVRGQPLTRLERAAMRGLARRAAAMRETPMLERRAFLSGLAALPLIGGGIRLIGSPTKAAVPVTTALLERYSDWLAVEYGETLIELAPRYQPEHAVYVTEWRREWCRDNRTLNSDPERGWFTQPAPTLPSTRAAVILSAAGAPIGGRDV